MRYLIESGVMWVIDLIMGTLMILQRYSSMLSKRKDSGWLSYELDEWQTGITLKTAGTRMGKAEMWVAWASNLMIRWWRRALKEISTARGAFLQRQPRNGPPAGKLIKPRLWPVVGCQVEAAANFHRLHDWCHQFFSATERTVRLDFFSTRIFLTVDPENIKHMLATNFTNYPKGERTKEKMKDLLGDGIFNADGETWKKQRKIATGVFNGKNLKDLSISSFRKDSLYTLYILQSAATSGESVNLQDLLLSMTMESISRLGFGIHEGRLYTTRSTFTNACDKANAMISTRFVNVWWKAHKMFRIGTEKSLIDELANLHSFTSRVIATRREEMLNSSSNTVGSSTFGFKERGDILSRLMAIGGESSTDKDLRDAIMNFTLAGRDTTAVTMAWFIYNLCKHPNVADKILQEVKGVLSAEKSLESFEEVADCLTFETLSHMQYLHAALSETLRLHPAVARDTKVAIHDDVLPDGTRIKGGDHVAFVPYSMGRMEFLWGTDALEFKPERWLKDGKFNPVSPYKFTSFQAGPRMCLGKDWAYSQMKMAMALLIYFFEFRLVPDQVVTYKVTMVLAMANGLQVTVHRRTTPTVPLTSITSPFQNHTNF